MASQRFRKPNMVCIVLRLNTKCIQEWVLIEGRQGNLACHLSFVLGMNGNKGLE